MHWCVLAVYGPHDMFKHYCSATAAVTHLWRPEQKVSSGDFIAVGAGKAVWQDCVTMCGGLMVRTWSCGMFGSWMPGPLGLLMWKVVSLPRMSSSTCSSSLLEPEKGGGWCMCVCACVCAHKHALHGAHACERVDSYLHAANGHCPGPISVCI